MNKQVALDYARAYLQNGKFEQDLQRRVAIQSDSKTASHAAKLEQYLVEEITPCLERLGFETHLIKNPINDRGPLLFAQRIEDENLPTVLTYGHGDVVPGYEGQWQEGLSPWSLTLEGDRWYGRGTADNKGQHSINLAALAAVLHAKQNKLGFNTKVIFETGEECGSPGLKEFCETNKHLLAADLFLASDGPRLNAQRPTIFLGSRGAATFTLKVNAREAGLHSGNWGGVKINPATVLANAIASLVDAKGRLVCRELIPAAMSEATRLAIQDLAVQKDSLGVDLDEDWGELGLSYGERLFAWNTLEVLAFTAGNTQNPVNAIPPTASAHCQLRFVVGTAVDQLEAIIRKHLDEHGFTQVELSMNSISHATRLDPGNQWVQWASKAIASVSDKKLAIIPNLGGTLPNHIFATILELPTIWVPHSYPDCAQHAPNEHILKSVVEEGLAIMTSLFWELENESVT